MLILEKEVAACRGLLVPGAKGVEAAAEFSLALPCVVITDGVPVTTSLSGIRGQLPTSTALSSAAMEEFFLLQSEYGFDEAFARCSKDGPEGEAFVEAWDQAQRDLDAGIVATLSDLAAMVTQAQRGWAGNSRRMLVVARRDKEVASGTIDVTWVLGAE